MLNIIRVIRVIAPSFWDFRQQFGLVRNALVAYGVWDWKCPNLGVGILLRPSVRRRLSQPRIWSTGCCFETAHPVLLSRIVYQMALDQRLEGFDWRIWLWDGSHIKWLPIVIVILSRDSGLLSQDLIENQILQFSWPDSAVGQISSNLVRFKYISG